MRVYCVISLILIANFLLFGCKQDIQKENSELELTYKLLDYNPDSVIRKARNMQVSYSEFDDSKLKWLLLEQNAWVKKQEWDSATRVAKELVSTAGLFGDTLTCAKSLYLLNDLQDGSISKGLEPFYRGSIRTFRQRGKFKEAIKLTITLANLLSKNGSYKESHELFMQSLKDTEKARLEELLPTIYTGLANNFSYNNDYQQAGLYFHQAVRTAISQKDSAILPALFMDLGIFHYETKSDSAMYYYMRALKSLSKRTPPLMEMKIKYNIAVLYYELKQYEKAEKSYISMLMECQQKGLSEGEAVAEKALGFLYRSMNRTVESIEHLQRAVSIASTLNNKYLKLQCILELQYTYESADKFKEAYKQSQIARELKSDILDEEKQFAILEMETSYATAKKELEIQQLKFNLIKKSIIQKGLWVIIFLLIIGIVFYVQRNRYLHERNRSFAALMHQYRAEKEKLEISQAHFIEGAEQEQKENKILWQQILAFIEKEKPFLNPRIKAEEMAESISMPYKKFSYLINELSGQNFTGFINSYRVKYARQLLEDDNFNHLKTEAIGEMAGFGTRQTFTNAFEKIVGVTPSYYREQIQYNKPPKNTL